MKNNIRQRIITSFAFSLSYNYSINLYILWEDCEVCSLNWHLEHSESIVQPLLSGRFFIFSNGFYCEGFIPDDSHIYFRK